MQAQPFGTDELVDAVTGGVEWGVCTLWPLAQDDTVHNDVVITGRRDQCQPLEVHNWGYVPSVLAELRVPL